MERQKVGSARCADRTPQRGVPTTVLFGESTSICWFGYDLKMKCPIRQHLPHEVPLWIDPAKEIYFITISAEPRGNNHLARSDIAERIFETLIYRNRTGVWFVHFGLLMPDHVHLLVSFPQSKKRIQTIISKWKEWTSKSLRIQWQRDFFEHRLRRDESERRIIFGPIQYAQAL